MSTPQLTVQIQGQAVVTADYLNGLLQTCDTYDELRSLVGVSGMQVYTRGAAAADDGGQGDFYWNITATGVDNGVTILKPVGGASTGRWVRISSGASMGGTVVLSGGSVAVALPFTVVGASYQITLAGNANETFYWTSKAAGGFTIVSSNASSAATVDWTVTL